MKMLVTFDSSVQDFIDQALQRRYKQIANYNLSLTSLNIVFDEIQLDKVYIIIGAGGVGWNLAYFLSRVASKVIVIDGDDLEFDNVPRLVEISWNTVISSTKKVEILADMTTDITPIAKYANEEVLSEAINSVLKEDKQPVIIEAADINLTSMIRKVLKKYNIGGWFTVGYNAKNQRMDFAYIRTNSDWLPSEFAVSDYNDKIIPIWFKSQSFLATYLIVEAVNQGINGKIKINSDVIKIGRGWKLAGDETELGAVTSELYTEILPHVNSLYYRLIDSYEGIECYFCNISDADNFIITDIMNEIEYIVL